MSKVKIIFLCVFLSNILYSQTIEIEDWKICALKITSYTESKIINLEKGFIDTIPVSKSRYDDNCLLIEKQFAFWKYFSGDFSHSTTIFTYDENRNLIKSITLNPITKILDGDFNYINECNTYDTSGSLLKFERSTEDGVTETMVYIYSEFVTNNENHKIQLPIQIEYFRNGILYQRNIIEYSFNKKK